jgi:tetratricopeptide (TPR) repeat protein
LVEKAVTEADRASWDIGDARDELLLYEEALEAARRANNKRKARQLVVLVGEHYWTIGEYERALPFAKEALALTRKLGPKRALRERLFRVADILIRLGRQKEAIRHLDEALGHAGKATKITKAFKKE